jgi:replicative DNA helicase
MIDREQPEFIELSSDKLDELLILKQQPIEAIPTPLAKWNVRCRDFGGGIGLAKGWHVTIGGNTGHGKSLLALNLARTATEYAQNVGFVSLEMSWPELATRYMAIVSGERVSRLEPGQGLDAYAHQRASKAVQRVTEKHGGRLITNERQISKLDDVEAAISYLVEYEGCRMVIVDYMQLVRVAGSRDLLDAVTAISGSVRWSAKNHKIVTVGLSQLNREASKDYENEPTPQSLMGGSPIENDSDQVLLIDHTSYAKHATANVASQKLLLGKNRHGPVGPIECQWNYNNLRIVQTEFAEKEPDRGEAWEPEELPLEGVA